MNRILTASASLFCFSLLSTSALADAIDPFAYACQGKHAGDTCTVTANCGDCADEHGTCLDTTCARADYQHWDRDASPSPPIEYYDCLICNTDGGVPWFPDAGSDAAHAAYDGAANAPDARSAPIPAPVEDPGDPPVPNRSPQGTSGGGPTGGGGSNGGCSVGNLSPENMIAAWAFASAVPLALSRVRRKKH
jgi:hypothetical protein